MAKKPVVKAIPLSVTKPGDNAGIRKAVTDYFGVQQTMFDNWTAFYAGMDEVTQGVAYKNLLAEIRTKDGKVLSEKECTVAVMLEYHRVCTAKSRYIADVAKRAAEAIDKAEGRESSTWYARDHELAGKRVKFLQAMKPEKTGGKKVDRLVVAWQVIAELTK